MSTNVLVIAAHPDDEVLGCGGTIARHVAQNDRVEILIVTHGIPQLVSPQLMTTIRDELMSAHHVLGVHKTHFLDFPAPKLDTIPRYELIDAIRNVIRNLEPQIVYSHHWGDIHLDHQIVLQSTLVASRPVNECSVRKILGYETLSETEWAIPAGEAAFVPTVFVDITNCLEVKLKAMLSYQSQLKPPPHPRSLESIKALARFRGGAAGLDAAEAFSLIREIVA